MHQLICAALQLFRFISRNTPYSFFDYSRQLYLVVGLTSGQGCCTRLTRQRHDKLTQQTWCECSGGPSGNYAMAKDAAEPHLG